jgi:hypothetical protein
MGAELLNADGQKDVIKLLAIFHNFAKALKINQ